MLSKALGYLVAIGPVVILIYIILKSELGEKFIKWLDNPKHPTCRGCGSDKFKPAPNAELVELHQALVSYYSADVSGGATTFSFLPPRVCANCGEPEY